MIRFTIRRFLSLIPTIFLIITFAFIIVRSAPGGPFSSEHNTTPEILENLQKKYHMDESMPRQYVRYMSQVIQGDLGPSFRYKDYTVNQLVKQALPTSMVLGFMALAVAVLFGIGIGIISALKQNTWIDYTSMSLAVIGISVPLFVIGPLLKLYLALKHDWLPTSGWLGERNGWLVLIMPVATLCLPYLASIARLTRASVLDVLRADFIRTARAKGIKERTVVIRHALRNSTSAALSMTGLQVGLMFAGVVVVETIFSWPGIGLYTDQSIPDADFPAIAGVTLVLGVGYVVINAIVDILQAVVDPRITLE